MKKLLLFIMSLLVFGTTMAQKNAERCETANNTQIDGTDVIWDVLWTFNTNAGAQAGVETDGNHVYCPTWNTSTITRYDMDGGNATNFTIGGVSAIRDMAYDGTYFYGAAADMNLRVMDLANETLIGTINASCSGVTGIRHIAYDPNLDNGNGGFWIGNWTELGAIDMDGNELVSNVGNADCYGSAWDDTYPDNPCLWLFQQNGVEAVTFHQFDINTMAYTGVTHEASDIPGYTAGSIAGGACIWDDPVSGLKLLIGNVQQTPNLIFAYELSGGSAAFTYDMELMELDIPFYAEIDNEVDIKGKVKNKGEEAVTSFDVSYTIDGGTAEVYSVTGVNITIGGTYDFTHGTPVSFNAEGSYEIEVTIENINGNDDEDPSNNTLSQSIGVVPFIPVKKVFGEEATGTWCGWCPRGTVAMDFMAETYPETWIGVAVHNGDPMVNSVYDQGIGSQISGYPNGLVDRAVGGINPANFENYYLDRMEAITPAAIDIVNFTYDPVTRVVDFDLKAEFVVDIDHELRFNVVLAEDSLWGTSSAWAQANYYSGGGQGVMGGYELLPNPVPAADMHYDHVAREILGGWDGTEGSLPLSIAAGETHMFNYTYTLPEDWIFEKMHFIGLLIDQTSGVVLNANNVLNAPDDACQNFDVLTVGDYVAGQLGGMWTTWSGTPGTAEDAMVSDAESNSGANSFVIDAGTIDLVFQLDTEPIDAGQWLYSNYIYVPTGFSGYFNVQATPTAGEAWVIDLYFDDGGEGHFATSSTETFTYSQDTWILVEINFDLDADFAEVYFDGALITVFAWDGTIGGIDYYGANTGGAPGAYFDDVCFGEGWMYTSVEEKLATTTQLYPNPASDLVNIKSDYTIESITVYNFAGQVVLTEAVNNTTYRVNTANFDAGIYLFQMETQEGRIAKRIIIE